MTTFRTGNVPGEYVTAGDDTIPPLVDFTKSPWSPDLLTATLTERLAQLGHSLGRAAKVASRRQWQIAEAVNKEWGDLEREYRAEGVTREMYLAACSQWLNACAGWSLLTSSGETLRRWCDVARQFQEYVIAGTYGDAVFSDLRDALSFDHFFQARKLYNAGDVDSPLVALEMADEKGWTAEEMYQALAAPPPNGAYYDWFARRVLALRESDLTQLPYDDAAYIRERLDEIAARLERVAR